MTHFPKIQRELALRWRWELKWSYLCWIVPIPIFTEALARRRGFGCGFRYIGKVVTEM